MLLKRIPAQQIQIIKIQQGVAFFGSEAKVFRIWHRCCGNTLQSFSSRIFEANFISELLEVVLSAEYEIQMRISILYPKF